MCSATPSSPGSAANSKPNVVVCLTDMLRSFEVGCYGNNHIRTPAIDRIASEGVRFELAVSNNPVCVPARCSLLSGQYSRTCMGTLDNDNGLWPDSVRERMPDPTLAECLRDAGYATGLVGKWHVHAEPRLLGFEHAVYPRTIHQHYGQEYVINDGEPFVVDEFGPDFEAGHVDTFIRDHRGNPFFLFHNISQPHMPVGPGNCPQRYLDMYDRETVTLRPNVFVDGAMAHDPEWFVIYTNPDYWYRKWITKEPKRATDTVPDDYDLRDLTAQYDALVTCADDQVAHLMQCLEANGVADNTIVLFTSDHGDNLGSHGKFNKQQLIEESIRIPFIAWAPSRFRPAVKRWDIAQLVDVMPTILEACDVPVPPSVQGMSLLPMLRGESAEGLPDRPAFIETSSRLIGIRTQSHLYGMRLTEDLQVIEDEALAFYDLRCDPYEFRNMAGTGEQEDVAAGLKERLKRWHKETPVMDRK